MNRIILLIPEKTDIEFEQVFAAWKNNGGEVKRLGKYWIKDECLSKQKIAIYGNQAFAFVLAQIYDVALVSPDDKMIAGIDKIWTKREIKVKTIADIGERSFPAFIKPAIPKAFTASVFNTLKEFETATVGLENTEELLIAAIVDNITAEARGYLKNGLVKDVALYEGSADIKQGELFLQSFAYKHIAILPEVVVVDIAYAEKTGWFILEFNACWGAGLNNCSADKVIDCIIGATIN